MKRMSKGVDGQLKLSNKVVNVMDQANRKVSVSLLRYKMDQREISYAQVRILARKKEDEKFQRLVYVNYKLKEFIFLLDVIISIIS